jgi:hypothetical protein
MCITQNVTLFRMVHLFFLYAESYVLKMQAEFKHNFRE